MSTDLRNRERRTRTGRRPWPNRTAPARGNRELESRLFRRARRACLRDLRGGGGHRKRDRAPGVRAALGAPSGGRVFWVSSSGQPYHGLPASLPPLFRSLPCPPVPPPPPPPPPRPLLL